MSTEDPPFDLWQIFAEARTADWPQYEAQYRRYVVGEQTQETQMAEGLRLWQTRATKAKGYVKNPDRAKILRSRGDAWKKEFDENLKRAPKGCGRMLTRAQVLVDTEAIKWRFTVHGLIILAIIYIREKKGDKSQIEGRELRELVEPHYLKKGRPSHISDNYWYESLRIPDIKTLLKPVE